MASCTYTRMNHFLSRPIFTKFLPNFPITCDLWLMSLLFPGFHRCHHWACKSRFNTRTGLLVASLVTEVGAYCWNPYWYSLQLFWQFTKCFIFSIPFIIHIQNMTFFTGSARTERWLFYLFIFTLCSSSFWTTWDCSYSLLWSMYFCGSKISGFII